MPKKKLIRQGDFPYHVTTRNNNRDWFSIPMYEVWDICKEALIYAQEKEKVQINCFVLMSNHYHLLLTTPNENIDRFMMHFNWRISYLISLRTSRINHKFSNRYKWSIVTEQNYLYNVYRYIYQNPIRAGISEACIDYPYTSLHFSSFEAELFQYRPHIDYAGAKQLIERRYDTEFDDCIRKSLKKSYFTPKQSISALYLKRLKDFKITI
ncbi:transposase IS200-like protein [Bacteriovorax sp. BAL6_X]|uniref:transposase n=1 Tax=Bacteriovorax sp. BAL6_X TaxID=1201290 RepID=UPI000386D843|nr:transposase [Bacteriovorax sp. BAL6_X]EPZ51692.1 transposase IS200-like protein [Bacteriovorax sp. BAL6_X]